MADSTLRIEALTRGTILYVRLFGAIDESFDAGDILSAGEGKELIINARGVDRVTSFGVREWVNGMARLAQVKAKILLYDCSPVLVRHLNMVANFAEHCQVVSIRAPYYCGNCGWDTEVELGVDAGAVVMPETPVVCKRCRSEMGFDEDPSWYCRFATRNQYPPLDPHVADFIQSYVRAGESEDVSSPPPLSTERVKYWLGKLGNRTLAMYAGAGAALVVLVIIGATAFSGDEGVPPEILQKYHARLAEDDFDGALAVVEQLEKVGEVPKELAESMRSGVAEKKEDTLTRAANDGVRLFRQKKYGEALASYDIAEKLGAGDATMWFQMAESHRKLGAGEASNTYYEKFLEADDVGKTDRYYDDALYWHADYLTKKERYDEARMTLDKLLALPRSNYRRSARRLMAQLPD